MIEARGVHVLHERFGAPYYWGCDKASERDEYPRKGCGAHARTIAEAAQQIFHEPLPPGKHVRFTKELAYYVVGAHHPLPRTPRRAPSLHRPPDP